MKKSFNIHTAHFIGIGGIGMSAIARIMQSMGYHIQGSELHESPTTRDLRQHGVTVFIGHHADHLGDADVVVTSSAIQPDNLEYQAARHRGIAVVGRAEMLAELMRFNRGIAVSGSHGKTTTSAMIAMMLDDAGIDPTVVVGGIIHGLDGNARLGKGQWVVAEADESDGSFVLYPAQIAVITSIDPEHLDFYGTMDALRAAYLSFMRNVPFYGVVIACADDAEILSLISHLKDRRILTYGVSPQADIRLLNPKPDGFGGRFDALIQPRFNNSVRRLNDLAIAVPGQHNMLNALAALAVGVEAGLDDDALRRGLLAFSGVQRRFNRVGEWRNATIIDDYGHHPTEISATLTTARQLTQGKLIAIVEPHRYSRLSSLFRDFATCCHEADYVWITPVYAAGETPIDGYDHHALAAELMRNGHRHARAVDHFDDLIAILHNDIAATDWVVCLGAGKISSWARALPAKLAAHEAENNPNQNHSTQKAS